MPIGGAALTESAELAKSAFVAGVRRGRQKEDVARTAGNGCGGFVSARCNGGVMGFVEDEGIPDNIIDAAKHLRLLQKID